jgi:GWxTD domain-containing protein
MKTLRTGLAVLLAVLAADAYGGQPVVQLDLKRFDNPGGQPYVEIHLYADSRSLAVAQLPDSTFQCSMQVHVSVSRDSSLIYTDRYNLKSPAAADKNAVPDLLDIQRIALDNGSYRATLTFSDNNGAGGESLSLKQDFAVDFPQDHIGMSDIELLASALPSSAKTRFSRNGLDMVPLASGFYPPEADRLTFYAEVYRSSAAMDTAASYMLRYRILGNESKKPSGNLGGIRKVRAGDVSPLLATLSIADLPSGNFQLVVEAVDQENRVLASRSQFFQRAHSIVLSEVPDDVSVIPIEGTFVEAVTDTSQLKEYIRCVRPISSVNEQLAAESQLKLCDRRSMQQFVLYFWMKRNRPDPESEWLAYKERVDAVNSSFRTFNRKGYETDRGRVYLQYGSPNERETSYNEPGNYPYEIWQYYRVNDQSNRIFVFMSHNMAANDFTLIHSDVTGEINQPRWQLMLENRENSYGNQWDMTESPDYFGKSRNINIRK